MAVCDYSPPNFNTHTNYSIPTSLPMSAFSIYGGAEWTQVDLPGGSGDLIFCYYNRVWFYVRT